MKKVVRARLWMVVIAVLAVVAAVVLPVSVASAVGTPTYLQSAASSLGSTGTTITQAFSGSNTAGNLIVVAVAFDTTNTTTFSCSDSAGNTYVNVVNNSDQQQLQAVALCYAANVSAGANTVTVTFPLTSAGRRIAVAEYSNVSGISPLDGAARGNGVSNTSTDGEASDPATTTVDGDLIFGVFENTSSSNSGTAGTGYTQRNNANSGELVIQDKVQTTAGTVVSTGTQATTGKRYVAALAAFTPSGAGVGVGGGSTGATPTWVQSDNAAASASSTTVSKAFTVPNTSNNLIVVMVAWDGASTSTFTCTDSKNNVYTSNIGTQNDTTAVEAAGVCYASTIAAGNNTVTVTFGAASSFRRMSISEYSGMSPVNVQDGAAASQIGVSTTSTDAVTSTSITTTANNDLIFSGLEETQGSVSTVAAGTNFRLRQHASANEQTIEDFTQPTAGSVAGTYTFGTTAKRYIAIVVAFKAGVTAGVTATATIDPALTFAIAGRGTVCNSQSATNFQTGSTATAVSLGHLNSGTVAGAAQDLSLVTNAGGGFTVQLRTPGTTPNPLRDGAGRSIADVGGTRASPGSAPLAGTAGFGYTSDDTSTAFTSNTWAKLTTSNDSVIIAAPGTMSKSACVGYEAAGASTTAAGSYTVIAIYTAVPTF